MSHLNRRLLILACSSAALLCAILSCSSNEPDTDSKVPLALSQVSTGDYFSCGIGPGSEVFCWGAGREGQLGAVPPENCGGEPGESPCASYPLAIGQSFASVEVGGLHACALTTAGSMFCWGDGTYGQLGSQAPEPNCSPQSTGCARTPLSVALLSLAVTMSVGGTHNCVLDATGGASCWGYNQAGRLGTGDNVTRFAPATVATNLRFTDISAGGTHTCAIAVGGLAYCWGYNHLGQLGDGTVTEHAVPAPVSTQLHFIEIVTGVAHTCARTASGTAFCWGAAGDGQLGTVAQLETCELYPCSTIPVPVAGGHLFGGLSAGAFTCGTTDDASYCWGDRGFGPVVSTPTSIGTEGTTGERFLGMSVATSGGCGIVRFSRVFCWGSDYQGRLGDGPTDGGPLPVVVQEAPQNGT
jgi:alpha-tubulin suppressor-like RCC1 family protein